MIGEDQGLESELQKILLDLLADLNSRQVKNIKKLMEGHTVGGKDDKNVKDFMCEWDIIWIENISFMNIGIIY